MVDDIEREIANRGPWTLNPITDRWRLDPMGKPEDIAAPLTEADVRRIARDEIARQNRFTIEPRQLGPCGYCGLLVLDTDAARDETGRLRYGSGPTYVHQTCHIQPTHWAVNGVRACDPTRKDMITANESYVTCPNCKASQTFPPPGLARRIEKMSAHQAMAKQTLREFLESAPPEVVRQTLADLGLTRERRDLLAAAAHDPAFCDHREIIPSSQYVQSHCRRCGAVMSTDEAREIASQERRLYEAEIRRRALDDSQPKT